MDSIPLKWRRARTTRPHASGFTLLELLVVLLLMAMIAALAAPNLERLYTSIQGKTEREYILDQFAGLGRTALSHGRTYVVSSNRASGAESRALPEPRPAAPLGPDADPYTIDLPTGWSMELSRPLLVKANGVCLGSGLTLRHEGRVDIRLALEPPYCRVATDDQNRD
ncbi:MAG: prepilin-type N-terminal cleavage/methylation domain-containing protein [Deltaproteobacteria bacterium]|nr:prepilin-type N-terminal cleavage/methylation domain-containing protein [Deltaproteobacteria bacterium]